MLNFWKIITNNYSTFYRFDTGDAHSIFFRVSVTLLISLFLSFSSRNSPEVFLSAVLAVEAILAGFSFSIMFFLLSEGNSLASQPDSLEDELLDEKLTQLSKEIFYNVSYFNMTAIGCVLFALLLLLPSINIEYFLEALHLVFSFDSTAVISTFEMLQNGFGMLLWFLLYLFLLESMYTFIRTTGRVNYYFSEKLSRNKR